MRRTSVSQRRNRCRGLAALLKNLRDVEGAKSLIVLSQGLMLEGAHSEASALAVLAAEARVTVNVLLYDVQLDGRVAVADFRDDLPGSRSASGRAGDAGIAIARLALPGCRQSPIRVRSAPQRDLGPLHAGCGADRVRPRRQGASDSRAGEPQRRPGPRTSSGAVHRYARRIHGRAKC